MVRFISIAVIVLSASLLVGASGSTQDSPYTTSLIAGRNYNAGTVSIWNNGEELHVTLTTTGGWVIRETQLYIGLEGPEENAPPGQFPYKHEGLSNVTQDSYTIPLGDWGVGSELCVAVHASVTYEENAETAWAWGPNSLPNGWGWWLGYTVTTGAGDLPVTFTLSPPDIEAFATASVVGAYLVVVVQSRGGWELDGTSVKAGVSANGLTKTYSHEGLAGLTMDQYLIPLSDLSATNGTPVDLIIEVNLSRMTDPEEGAMDSYDYVLGLAQGSNLTALYGGYWFSWLELKETG